MLKDLLSYFEQNFGKNKVINNADLILTIEGWKELTGLDTLPRGCIIELFGKEAIGKSTLAFKIIGEIQKKGFVAYIDSEYSFIKEYASKMGVDLLELIYSTSVDIKFLEGLIKNGVDLIVIDSLTATDIDQLKMNEITSLISKSNTTLIFTNQIRDKMSRGIKSAGNRWTKNNFGIRLEILKFLQEKDNCSLEVKCIKSRYASPFKQGLLKIY